MGWLNRILRKENQAYRAVMASMGPGSPIWSNKDYASLSKAGYQNVASVYACVSLIAKTASRIDWCLTDARGNEVERHPLLALLARPNEFESGITFTEKAFSFLLLSGNSYINKVHGLDSMPPRYLYVLRPDRMKPVAGNWREPIAGWAYTANGINVPYKTSDILHLLEFHPTDDWFGLSRLEVASRHIDISNEATSWNKKLLQNDMRPAGVMNFKETLTPADREDFRKQIEYRSSGYDNAGRFIVTEGEATWIPMGLTAKEMDWLNGQKFTLRQICSIFGIPSELLGDSENKTYSNYQEARKALYEETVLPLMDVYTAELNSWLVPLFGTGLVLDYDKDAIEALQEEREKKYTYLQGADWLTVNEKRLATGYDEITEGDVVLVPISSVPLEEAAAEPEPVPAALAPFTKPPAEGDGEDGPADEGEPEEDANPPAKAKQTKVAGGKRAIKAVRKSFWTEKGRRAKLWTAFDLRTKARARVFKSRALRYMLRQADEIRERAMAFPTVGAVDPKMLLNVAEEAGRYQKEFMPWYVDHALRAGQAGLSATKGRVFVDEPKGMLTKKDKPAGYGFELTPQREEELTRMVFNSGTKVNESVIDVIYEVQRHALESNATVKQFAEQIWEQVDDMSPARARLWAETEATKVDNWGMLEGFKEDPNTELKGWNCQMLETSREDHIGADGQERRLDEDFDIGGEPLAYPGDPAGSAWNVCNCRCSMYPITEDSWGEEDVSGEVAAPEAAEWKPAMSVDEADAWAKDSAVKDTLNHNTRAENAKGIAEDGFIVGTGSLYGEGVYMSSNPLTEYGDVNLKVRINVQKVYTFEDSTFGKASDWWVKERYEQYGPIGRGKQVAEWLKSQGYDAMEIPNRYKGTWHVVLDPKNVTVVKGGGK